MKKNGFTLIELLLYISITGVMVIVVFTFLAGILQARVRNQATLEVEQQGVQALQVVTNAIRNAEAIQNLPAGASSSSLVLTMPQANDSPTVFSLAGNVLEIQEGSSQALSLMNNKIVVSELSFQNLSRSLTPGIIRIQLTLAYNNPEGRNEYEYSKTFYVSASLRK